MRRAAAALAIASLAGCVPRPVAPPPAPARVAPSASPRMTAAPAPAALVLEGRPEQGGLIAGTVPTGTRTLLLDGKPIPFAPDGRFIAAFDRDAGPTALLEARLDDGRAIDRPLAVAPRAWRIERLPTLAKHAQPEPEFLRLRAPELAQIAAARARVTDAAGWRQRFTWPVHGRQTGWFGSQRIYAGEPGEYHSGADVAVPIGTPVLAPADGVVVLAADHPFTLEGNLLLIDHGMGLTTALLHLSRIVVRPGETVRQGQVVALSGMTGRATGPHLHWGLRWQTARIDPLLIAGAVPLH